MNKKYLVLVYLGDSADEEMFHVRGIGDKNFVLSQITKSPSDEEFSLFDEDNEMGYEENEHEIIPKDESLVCGEDIPFIDEWDKSDYVVEIYHKDQNIRCFSTNEEKEFEEYTELNFNDFNIDKLPA